MTIALAEDWLVARCKEELGADFNVDTGPGDWDGSYLKNLIRSLPAVRIVWDGGSARDSTSLSFDGTWTFYVVSGWAGQDQAHRRRAAAQGAYVILTALANRFHNAPMNDENDEPEVEGAGRMRVAEIANEWSGEWDRVGVAIYALVIEQELPLELPIDPNITDWLRTHVDYDLPGVGEDVDAESDIGFVGNAGEHAHA